MPTAAEPDFWSGKVYITPVNSLGVATGNMIGCLEANLFTYQPTSAPITITSKKHDSYGSAINTVQLPSAPTIGINFFDSPGLIKAASVFGTSSVNSVLAATGTAAPTVAVLDGWVDLGRKNIDPLSFVLTSDPAGTTHAIDVDYEFNARLGIYRAIPGGGIADAAPLLATWTSAAYSTIKTVAGTQSQFRIRVDFDGKNLATDKFVNIVAPILSIAPGTPIDFLGATHTEYQFTGTAEAPSGGNPLTIEEAA
jgi:hypothetical protein